MDRNYEDMLEAAEIIHDHPFVPEKPRIAQEAAFEADEAFARNEITTEQLIRLYALLGVSPSAPSQAH